MSSHNRIIINDTSILTKYETFEDYILSLGEKINKTCDICYLYNLKKKKFANNIAIYDHMISKHEKLIWQSTEHCKNIHIISKVNSYTNTIKGYDFDAKDDAYEVVANDDTVDIKIKKHTSAVFKRFEFEFNSSKVEPGKLLPKDIDFKKYLTKDSINSIIHLVDDLTKESSIEELQKIEPGAIHIPFDSFNREQSLSKLSIEVANFYKASKIKPYRKVEVQKMIDIIRLEIKKIQITFPVFNDKFKSFVDEYDCFNDLVVDNWHRCKSDVPKFVDNQPADPSHFYYSLLKWARKDFDAKESRFISNYLTLGTSLFVEVHGSFATGLATMSSDLDLALFVSNTHSQKWLIKESCIILFELLKVLENNADLKVTLNIMSRFPSLRVNHKKFSFTTIITIGTDYTPYQTVMLLQEYKKWDEFAPIVIYLKALLNQKLAISDNSLGYIITVMTQIYLRFLCEKLPASVGIAKPDPSNSDVRLSVGKPYYPQDDYKVVSYGDFIHTFLNYFGGISLVGSDCFDFKNSSMIIGHHNGYAFYNKSLLDEELRRDPFIIILGDKTRNMVSCFTEDDLIKFRIAMRELTLKLVYQNKNLME